MLNPPLCQTRADIHKTHRIFREKFEELDSGLFAVLKQDVGLLVDGIPCPSDDL